MDTLKKRFSDLSDEYKYVSPVTVNHRALKDRYLKETSELKDEIRGGSDETEKLKRNVNNFSRENQELGRANKSLLLKPYCRSEGRPNTRSRHGV